MFEKLAEQLEQDIYNLTLEKLAAIYSPISSPALEQQLLRGPGLLSRIGQKVKGFFSGNKRPGYFTTSANAMNNVAYNTSSNPAMSVRPAFDRDAVRGATDMLGETNWGKLRALAKDMQQVNKKSLSDKQYKKWVSGQDKIIENSRDVYKYSPALDQRLDPGTPMSNRTRDSIQNYFNPPVDF